MAPRKAGLAFTLGAMGSQKHNFYNDVYKRTEYADIAIEVQNLWLQRQREAAIACIPDEMVLKTNLLGTAEMIRERIRLYQKVGVTTLRVDPAGNNVSDRISTLAQLVSTIHET